MSSCEVVNLEGAYEYFRNKCTVEIVEERALQLDPHCPVRVGMPVCRSLHPSDRTGYVERYREQDGCLLVDVRFPIGHFSKLISVNVWHLEYPYQEFSTAMNFLIGMLNYMHSRKTVDGARACLAAGCKET